MLCYAILALRGALSFVRNDEVRRRGKFRQTGGRSHGLCVASSLNLAPQSTKRETDQPTGRQRSRARGMNVPSFPSFEACFESPFRGTPNGKRTPSEACRTPNKDGKRRAADGWGFESSTGASSATPRSTPKFSGGDRFIPNRSVMDFDVSHFELTRASMPGAENANVNASPAKEEYKKELAATLMQSLPDRPTRSSPSSQAQRSCESVTAASSLAALQAEPRGRLRSPRSTRGTSRRRPSASSTRLSYSTTTTSTCSTGPRPTCSASRSATRSTCGTPRTARSSS